MNKQKFKVQFLWGMEIYAENPDQAELIALENFRLDLKTVKPEQFKRIVMRS